MLKGNFRKNIFMKVLLGISLIILLIYSYLQITNPVYLRYLGVKLYAPVFRFLYTNGLVKNNENVQQNISPPAVKSIYDYTSPTGSLVVKANYIISDYCKTVPKGCSLSLRFLVELSSINYESPLKDKTRPIDVKMVTPENPNAEFSNIPPGPYKVSIRDDYRVADIAKINIESAKVSTIDYNYYPQ